MDDGVRSNRRVRRQHVAHRHRRQRRECARSHRVGLGDRRDAPEAIVTDGRQLAVQVGHCRHRAEPPIVRGARRERDAPAVTIGGREAGGDAVGHDQLRVLLVIGIGVAAQGRCPGPDGYHGVSERVIADGRDEELRTGAVLRRRVRGWRDALGRILVEAIERECAREVGRNVIRLTIGTIVYPRLVAETRLDGTADVAVDRPPHPAAGVPERIPNGIFLVLRDGFVGACAPLDAAHRHGFRDVAEEVGARGAPHMRERLAPDCHGGRRVGDDGAR